MLTHCLELYILFISLWCSNHIINKFIFKVCHLMDDMASGHMWPNLFSKYVMSWMIWRHVIDTWFHVITWDGGDMLQAAAFLTHSNKYYIDVTILEIKKYLSPSPATICHNHHHTDHFPYQLHATNRCLLASTGRLAHTNQHRP